MVTLCRSYQWYLLLQIQDRWLKQHRHLHKTLTSPKFELKLGSSFEDLQTAKLTATELDISGDVDVDGTLETDALLQQNLTQQLHQQVQS